MPSSNSYQEEARRVLRDFQAKSMNYEKKEIIQLSNKWDAVSGKLDQLITKLSNEKNLSPDKLYRLNLYQDFLQVSKKQVTQYNLIASSVITDGQAFNAKVGLDIAQSTISLVTIKFNRINIQAVSNMIGKSSDGSPLYQLLEKSYGASVDKLTNSLIQGTALGYNPRKVAYDMARSMDGNLSRALTICRTEQLNVLRETSLDQMKTSGVVDGWIRIEQPDCCDDCADENGQHYDFEDEFDSHPNCRGACIPDMGLDD
jgi:hypothetical protein